MIRHVRHIISASQRIKIPPQQYSPQHQQRLIPNGTTIIPSLALSIQTYRSTTLFTTGTAATKSTTVNRRKRKKHGSYLNRLGQQQHDSEDNSATSKNTTTKILTSNDPFQNDIDDDSTTTDISFDEYMEIATLSPWVPTPDPVARRMLQMADASSDDIHYDLGSGDGRLNFMAIDAPFHVKQSTGIEIDDSLLQASNDRLNKRHPRPTNLQFLKEDLMPSDTTDSEKKDDIATSEPKPKHPVDISNATIVTMYFVEEALQKIKPMLEQQLFRTGCRVITCGYDIDGWEPNWVEIVLGLPVYMYVLDENRHLMEDSFLLTQQNNKDQADVMLGNNDIEGPDPSMDDNAEEDSDIFDDDANDDENDDKIPEPKSKSDSKQKQKWTFSK